MKEIKTDEGVVIGTVVTSLFNCGLCIIDSDKLETISQSKFNIEGWNVVFFDPINLWKTATNIEEIAI